MIIRWRALVGLAWLAISAAGVPAQRQSIGSDAHRQGPPPAPPAMLPHDDPRPVAGADSDQWLRDRLERIESELAAMRASGGATAVPAPPPRSAPANPSPLFPECATGCLPAPEPEPEFPLVRVTGVFHLDWGAYDQDAVNRATLGNIENGLGFRRARAGVTGRVTEDTSYIMEFDFAQSQARIVDVWMEFEETPLGNLRIGRYRQPFGMAALTSIRDIPFLERPLPFALAPFRQSGAMLQDTALGDSLTWAVSGYRYLSDNFGNVYADGGYGTAQRVTTLLIDRGDSGLIHVGADYSYNEPGRDAVQFVSTNEFFLSQNPLLGPAGLGTLPIVAVPPFVNTGEIPTAATRLFNLEAAVSRGNMILQSEVRWARVEHLDGTTNTFPGAYAHVRWVLTGESIPYLRQAGVFGGVNPRHEVDLSRGCWGAWEIAARVSYLDLNGANLPGPGRRLTDTTLGLNWYVNDYAKFQLNWIDANLDDPTLGSSDARTYAFRAQLDF